MGAEYSIVQNTVKNNSPAVFYFHPWEIDADQPVVAGLSLLSKFRHYINLEKTEKKLEKLLKDFNWNRIDKIFLNN